MDSQMQQRFLQHIIKFFTPQQQSEDKEETTDSASQDGDEHGQPDQRCPDVPELLGLLGATGFKVKYSDKSDFGGSSNGCRAIILCKRSGARVVMDGEGPCSCPPETTFKQLLDVARAGPPLSRAPSPTPSTSAMLEAPLYNKERLSLDVGAPPPGPVRQRTWSREDNAIAEEGSLTSPMSRRLSAPPLQSAWTTMNGDELNVLAATDLLQEAMCLLSGVKKVNLRNTPIGPSRRLSATATSRRASSDAFVMPMRPLSRTSSASSGLASSRSTTSLQSTQSSTHGDTPRPPRPTGREGQIGTSLRRSVSVTPSSASRPQLARTKSDGTKTGAGGASIGTRIPGSKTSSLIKPPSAMGVGKATPRPPTIRTNGSLTSTKRLIPPKMIVKSPEVESIKL